jgi:hypothetical protein
MPYIKKIVLITAILTPLSIFAQKKQSKNPFRRAYREAEPIAFRLSGVGSLNTIWGGKLSMDFPLKIVEQRGLNGVFGGRNFTETYITLDAGVLHKNAAFEDAFVALEYTYRRMGENGYFFQLSPIGVGGHRVLLPFGDSLAAPSSGFKQDPLTLKKWYVGPSVSVGFGRDFSVKRRTWRGIPLILMGKVGITSLLPYKTYGYLIPTAELSIGYRFQGLTIAARQVRRD